MAPIEEFFIPRWSGALHNPLLVAAGLILAFLVSTAIYRLYLSPLSSFPGPKIAGKFSLRCCERSSSLPHSRGHLHVLIALTSWYACYYDLVAGGQYIWVIEEMHKKYGITLIDCSNYRH